MNNVFQWSSCFNVASRKWLLYRAGKPSSQAEEQVVVKLILQFLFCQYLFHTVKKLKLRLTEKKQEYINRSIKIVLVEKHEQILSEIFNNTN